MRNKLVVTRADDGIKEQAALSHPFLKEYADWCDADFIILDEGHHFFRIMEIAHLFNEYERIACIDSDILINKPVNLFEAVDQSCIGSIYEDVGSRQPNRRATIRKIQDIHGDVKWRRGYINTGVCVFSRHHTNIFAPIDGKYWREFGWDDIHLGYNIHKFGHKIQELPFQFNHMNMFSEPWKKADRWESHFIHYAGTGRFDIDPTGLSKPEIKLAQMRADYEKWKA